jgi:hypothetical protein
MFHDPIENRDGTAPPDDDDPDVCVICRDLALVHVDGRILCGWCYVRFQENHRLQPTEVEQVVR